MASLTIRKLDDAIKAELRLRAAQHGRSVEDEVRNILREAASETPLLISQGGSKPATSEPKSAARNGSQAQSRLSSSWPRKPMASTSAMKRRKGAWPRRASDG